MSLFSNEQLALDGIHALAYRLRNSVTVNTVVSGPVGVRNRLAMQTLKQLELLSEVLFKSGGQDAAKILETLEELNSEAAVLFAKTEVNTDNFQVSTDSCHVVCSTLEPPPFRGFSEN